MPSKSANVKNEKQYEALKDKGMSKERAAKIANSPDASKHGGETVRRWRRRQAGRDHRAEEGGRAQGRQGDRQQELLTPGDSDVPGARASRRRIVAAAVSNADGLRSARGTGRARRLRIPCRDRRGRSCRMHASSSFPGCRAA